MARERDPARDKALDIYKEHNGDITNRAIADILKVDEKKIAVWKSRDKWNVVQQKKKSVVQQKKSKTKQLVEENDLTEKQRLFCIYFIKCFNATKAYQKAYACAYSTAMTNGNSLLRKTTISKEIDRLKSEQTSDLKLGVRDVLQKYIDIAFADITDFVEFGSKKASAKDDDGIALTDDDGKEITYNINRVDFRNSDEVDGTIITEVKQGKDGVSVKLADKMKALEMLTKYFDFLSENDKKKLQEEKMKADIDKTKAEIIQISGVDNESADGWQSAIKEVAERRKQLRAVSASEQETL